MQKTQKARYKKIFQQTPAPKKISVIRSDYF